MLNAELENAVKLLDFTVTENKRIACDIYRMQLSIDNCQLSIDMRPGQFVNIAIEGHYLRRPISVCNWDGSTLTLIYKAVGEGTKKLACYMPGEELNALAGLGNGYTIVPAERPLLIGGGVGVPPLYFLAKKLLEAGQRPVALLGFNTHDDVFYKNEFERLCETRLVVGGYVTDALPGLDLHPTKSADFTGTPYDALYCCGPEPMLKAVYHQAKELPPGRAQFSFERRMACGFGACMACSCKTVEGYKRICKEGPVLRREEILWN